VSRRRNDQTLEIVEYRLDGFLVLGGGLRQGRDQLAGAHCRHHAVAFGVLEVRFNPRPDALERFGLQARLVRHMRAVLAT
jgi:hypothetical protein